MMKMNTNYPELKPEHSLLLTYTDVETVAEIDHYYINKMKELRNSQRLTEEEKTGQRAFLHQQWQKEVIPYLILWSVKLYTKLR